MVICQKQQPQHLAVTSAELREHDDREMNKILFTLFNKP